MLWEIFVVCFCFVRFCAMFLSFLHVHLLSQFLLPVFRLTLCPSPWLLLRSTHLCSVSSYSPHVSVCCVGVHLEAGVWLLGCDWLLQTSGDWLWTVYSERRTGGGGRTLGSEKASWSAWVFCFEMAGFERSRRVCQRFIELIGPDSCTLSPLTEAAVRLSGFSAVSLCFPLFLL